MNAWRTRRAETAWSYQHRLDWSQLVWRTHRVASRQKGAKVPTESPIVGLELSTLAFSLQSLERDNKHHPALQKGASRSYSATAPCSANSAASHEASQAVTVM
uniref:Uncharacterized protein n=1 Tax=Coccidioides posadasii RMSCC 3488 TaxID=454284 RepID=A0A0J6I8G3_COCPO|nr:hypothetical protein CPAG_04124 [Coccidioides posadasii RMSCC 3488]